MSYTIAEARSPGEILETLATSLTTETVPREEITHLLDLLEADLDAWRRQCSSLELPDATPEECGLMVSGALDALTRYGSGIEALRRYLEDPRGKLLEDGIQFGREGDRFIDTLMTQTSRNLHEFGVADDTGREVSSDE